jgi:hypothetical protein
LANKLAEHAARLAAVLALVDDIHSSEVSSSEMTAGVKLAEHYAAEALRLLDSSRISAELMLAQRLLTWLIRTWQDSAISLPDIYQRGPNAIRDQAAARRMVGILEEHGWLSKIPGGAVVGEQHRRDAWKIVRP